MPRSADRIAGRVFGGGAEPRKKSFVVVRQRAPDDPKSSRSSTATPTDRKHTRLSIVEATTPEGNVTELVVDENGQVVLESDPGEDYIRILEQTNMDGLRHLQSGGCLTRGAWLAVILFFVFLAFVQIFIQVRLYWHTPVATNIEADYPKLINFPTVAICNNNQYRLTYITGARVQNRRPRVPTTPIESVDENDTTVFDNALRNSWDMDAVKFLRNAAHWKSRMILRCTWPNGTNCRISDFKAVWTLTGLCWAINSDPHDPVQVTNSGAGYGLRLLLNIERYERVESCTPKFQTASLPGLKVLIYNQTDMPISSLDGVNVPPGFTLDIPFRIQHRRKYPGMGCVEDNPSAGQLPFNENVRSCALRKYLEEIERECNCSMRRAYNPNPDKSYPFCNVDQYFSCVIDVLRYSTDLTALGADKCATPCEEIDYLAWQNMNLLPSNIFPALIDTEEQEDEGDVAEEVDHEDLAFVDELDREEHYQCHENRWLDMQQVSRIKREAQRAYEKQSRHQEDIVLKMKRLISRVKQAAQKLTNEGWGWHEDDYLSVNRRLQEEIECYANMSVRNEKLAEAIALRPAMSEEKLAQQYYQLLDPLRSDMAPTRYKAIGDLKTDFGETAEILIRNANKVSATVDKLWQLYDKNNFAKQLGYGLERMDRVLELTEQYEKNKLQRRAWADKMQSRNMRHFFEQEFYERWYNPTSRDLDLNLVQAINDLEAEALPTLLNMTANGTAVDIGAVLYFGKANAENRKQFTDFLDDIVGCTRNELLNASTHLQDKFKSLMHEFQAAYTNLYKKELPDYLENFDFGAKFVKDNFALINVFLYKMHVEHWKQDSTYSIWSLLCDVGGALGLFLGASLLTLIELIYLCCQYGLCNKKTQSWMREKSMRVQEKTANIDFNKWRKSISKTPSHASFDEGKNQYYDPESHEEKTTDDDELDHPADQTEKTPLQRPKLADLAKKRKKKREEEPKDQLQEVDEIGDSPISFDADRESNRSRPPSRSENGAITHEPDTVIYRRDPDKVSRTSKEGSVKSEANEKSRPSPTDTRPDESGIPGEVATSSKPTSPQHSPSKSSSAKSSPSSGAGNRRRSPSLNRETAV